MHITNRSVSNLLRSLSAAFVVGLLLITIMFGTSVSSQRRGGIRGVASPQAAAPEAINAAGPLYISEVLWDPAGTPNEPNQYIEIRGTPGAVIPAGTYFLGIEGDSTSNEGDIQDIFDLSGKTIGSNGFLVLLQKDTLYIPAAGASVYTNAGSGDGFGTGSAGSSTIGYTADNGTNIEGTSVTFMIVQSATTPTLASDIDADDSGTPDGALYSQFVIQDSVGALDTGATDIVYGLFNFASGAGGTASTGPRLNDTFTASYVARRNSSTGSIATDWYASSTTVGTAPNWTLSTAGNTYPDAAAGSALNHIGSANPTFGPTASGVSISGYVRTASGAGITNARVTISGNSLQESITVITGRRGTYSFEVESGETYVVTVGSRRFSFGQPSQVVTVTDNVAELNFVAN